MRRILLATTLVAAPLAGCSKDAPSPRTDDTAAPAKVAIPEITVEQVDQLLAQGACTPVDANGARTREKQGVLPGAVLLTDSEAYSVKELPADKARPLVFYCANEACSASHEAAARARHAGYQDVKVMPAGIAGWKQAGKATQAI